MRKVISFFKNPIVVAVLGLTAVGLIIWFVGPLIAIAGFEPLISPVARLLLILVVVVAWGTVQLRRRLREKRANEELAEGLVADDAKEDPTAARRDDEIEAVQERFSDAVEFLRKSHPKSGRKSLYALPWYVIIGPPGSGKTTALENSGLRFPLEDRFGKEALDGVGGTRNCKWWFTDEAILLDTAGRYTTQDSDEAVDRAGWQSFLELLKKHRRRRPLNGVFVALSLSDLLLLSEDERATQIQALRQRISELYDYFGIRFPIYALLTKADLIAGFNEFFEGMTKDERAQVWGFTLPLEEFDSETDPTSRINEEFELLVKRLSENLVGQLERERDPQRRALMLGFPRQIALLRPLLAEVVAGAFRPSRFEQAPLLRGIYFTSGTQEGTPIDRLLGSVARSFGLGEQAVSAGQTRGRSFFIKDVLQQVVFREANLVGTNRRLEQLRAWSQRGAYAAAAAIVLVAGTAWIVSYRSNQQYIESVNRQTAVVASSLEELTPENTGAVDTLPVLNAAREIPGGYADRDAGAPISQRFGLYQGRRIGSAAETTYRRLLEETLLPRMTLRLEQQVRESREDPDLLFESLRIYRMLGEGTHFDGDLAQAWIELDWETNGQLAPNDAEALESHLAALLEEPPAPAPVPLDGALIRRSQRTLRDSSLGERAYRRLKRQSRGRGLEPFSIASAGGKDAPLVFARKSGAPLTDGIPGLFTRKGYTETFLEASGEFSSELAEETWVLGDAGAAEGEEEVDPREIQDEVVRLYLAEYGDQYRDLLSDVTIVPIDSMDKAVYVLQILSDDDSPLLKLLGGVAEETSLGEAGKESDQAEDTVADGAIDAAKDRIRELLGQNAQRIADNVTRGYASPAAEFAQEQFGDLHEQVLASEGTPPPFQSILDILNELYVFLDSIRKNPNAAEALMEGSPRLDAIVGSLERESGRQPDLVQGVLAEVASTTKSLRSGDIREHLNAQWRSKVLPYCRKAIAGRYPITRGSRTEISLNDFGRFFGPGGMMESFFEQNLAKLVDASSQQWRWRSGGSMAGGSTGALAQFQRARRITETFFGLGGKLPSLSFDLTPVTMDTSITRLTLDIEGQTVSYSHGPTVPTSVSWPGPGPRQVRLQFSPATTGGSGITESGAWGWFRLLDRSKVSPAGIPEQFNVTFSVGGRSAQFLLAATSAYNPFGSNLLRAFSCPGSL